MSYDFFDKGLQFTCTRCSGCCRHSPGYVFLSEIDLEKLSAHCGLSQKMFIRKYCRIVDIGGFKRLSLVEKKNFDCIFWGDEGCEVYQARPFQCRSFPFWPQHLSSREDWDAAAADCPGMNQGKLHTKEEIENWLKQRLEEPFIKL